jgi:hypothetical protein
MGEFALYTDTTTNRQKSNAGWMDDKKVGRCVSARCPLRRCDTNQEEHPARTLLVIVASTVISESPSRGAVISLLIYAAYLMGTCGIG